VRVVDEEKKDIVIAGMERVVSFVTSTNGLWVVVAPDFL
jgi:hypothetical protein